MLKSQEPILVNLITLFSIFFFICMYSGLWSLYWPLPFVLSFTTNSKNIRIDLLRILLGQSDILISMKYEYILYIYINIIYSKVYFTFSFAGNNIFDQAF